MKIVFLDADTVGNVSNLSRLGELGDFITYPLTPANMRIERVKGADVVITNKVVIDKEVMDACPGLKLICVAATGTNNIDLTVAREKGIAVKNVAGYSTESVAQSTFALLFYLMNKLRYYDDYVKSGDYCKSPVFTHHGREIIQLYGKRFGVIGLGSIGTRVAEIATAFGCETVYYSTSGRNTNSEKYKHLELDELLGTADVVSVHCPLNENTSGLIDIQRLRMMKPSAYLLNMGRGGIIVEKDLAKAIKEGVIAGAGIDVLVNEPINKDNPLLALKESEKIVITPHVAWAGIDSRNLLIEKIYYNISGFIKSYNQPEP
ncbi:MAG: D-2-hydroxyacid dehydrogenase [Bacteroidales bacterium]|nr:D-2-hydroxyacid dehydrogenase [Bacteroidales bacterium]